MKINFLKNIKEINKIFKQKLANNKKILNSKTRSKIYSLISKIIK